MDDAVRYTAAPVNTPSVKSSVEVLDDNKVKVSVEVDESTLEVAVDEAFKKIAREVRVPGFRPGKAPRRVLEANIGAGYARAEAIQSSMPGYYGAALRDNAIDAIAQPEIEFTDGEESGPLCFEAVVETRPSFDVDGYADIEVKVPNPIPDDDVIEAQVDLMRGRFADLVDVDRPAASGDTVSIDIVGEVDGEPLPGLCADDYSYEVGSGGLGDGFDEHIEGVSAGDDLDFSTDHPVQEDTVIDFDVQVHAVKEKVLPDLTDEWVDENTEFDSVDEMRDDITGRLTTSARSRAEHALREGAAAAVAELISEEIPDSLIESEMNDQVQNLAYSLQAQGISIEQWLGYSGKTEEEFAAELRVGSATSARVDLGLRAIATAESLDPTEGQITEELDRIAVQLDEPVAVIRERLEHNDGLLSLRADLRKRAAMEWLVERVAIVDETTGVAIDRSALESPEAEPTGTADSVPDGVDAEEDDQ